MPHQLPQHVDRCAGVRVPLGVAVPVGVEEHRGLVELGAIRAPQRLQFVNLAAMGRGEGVIGDRLGSPRVTVCPREQRKVGQRGVREALLHTLFVFDDQFGGGVADREPASDAVVLEVGVDQRVLAVAVLVQAIPRQEANLGGPAAGVDEQLDRNPDIVSRRGFEPVQGRDQGGQHRIGQCAAGPIVLGHRR